MNFHSTLKILLLGGRYSLKHAKANIKSSRNSFDTLILDGTGNDSLNQWENLTSQFRSCRYILCKNESFYERICNNQDIISKYRYVFINAVDDFIDEISVQNIIHHDSKSDISTRQFIIGFGPDMSYRKIIKNKLFAMPRQIPFISKPLSYTSYWAKLRWYLQKDNPYERLFGMLTNVGMFPYFYSVFQSNQFLLINSIILDSFRRSNILPLSGMAGCLSEYTYIAIGALLSKIHVSDKIFRLGNYSSNSAGSDSFNYRSIHDSVEIDQQVKHFFYILGSNLVSFKIFEENQYELFLAGYRIVALNSFASIISEAHNNSNLLENQTIRFQMY